MDDRGAGGTRSLPVIQPWDTAYDLGLHDEHIQTHKSFASVWHAGKPVVAKGDKFWQFNGGYAVYPHSGYAWAWTRRALDRIGGLFELGGMGSGDHHMALGLVGAADSSMPGGVGAGYRAAVKVWESRMVGEINGKLGVGARHDRAPVPRPPKTDRGYLSRWQMFLGDAQKLSLHVWVPR